MRKIVFGILILSVFSAFSACKRGYETYSDSLNGFEMLVPKGWAFVPPSAENVVAGFHRENADSEDPTGIVVSAGELPADFSAKEFQDKLELIFPTILKKYVKRGSFDVKAGDLSGRVSEYECVMNDRNVIRQQAFFTGNNSGYSVIVTFAADKYTDREKELAHTVIESFKITGSAKK
jgi:hypothetical protein